MGAMVLCACGCGESIPATDRRGRARTVKKGHSAPSLRGIACRVAECGAPAKNAKQRLCNKHYLRQRKHGDPLVMKRAPNGAGSLNSQGYRKFHRTNGSEKEHIVVAERALGRPLPLGAEVHHVNEIKSDNSPRNLVICPNRAYHMLLHVRTRALEACGRADWRRCSHCDRYDDPTRLKTDGFHHFHATCRSAYLRANRERRKAAA